MWGWRGDDEGGGVGRGVAARVTVVRVVLMAAVGGRGDDGLVAAEVRTRSISSSPALTDTKTIPFASRARGSPIPTSFPDDPYMLVRQAYLPTAVDTESEPFEDLSKVTEVGELSPSSFRKRYKSSYETPSSSSSLASSPTLPSQTRYLGTSKLIAETETECDESEAKGTNSESEEAALEDQQQQAVSAEGTAKDESLGLGYKAARCCALERAGDTVPSTYEVGYSSRSTPDQQLKIAGETPTQTHARLLVRTTWEDPEDSTVYMDIECDIPLVHSPVQTPPSPVGTPASPEWSPELKSGAQLEFHESIIHTHTKRLDALPPSLLEGQDQDTTELFSRSEAVCEEIHSHRFRLRSLERVQDESKITMGTLWRPILTLEA
ncbi:hypothetical protein Tco_0801758 [Tanacetum coccineum]|uniref:Uncharacterized protein n=1 Tax=Tanacetum coccineum TaxID=301880 RepID=A0ABQ4ZXS6_9ASTR